MQYFRQKGSLWLLFGGFLFVLPLSFCPENFDPNRPIQFLLFALFTFGALFWLLVSNPPSIPSLPKIVFYPFLGFLVWGLVTLPFAFQWTDALLENGRWIMLFGFGLFTVTVIAKQDSSFQLLSTTASILLIVVGIGGWLQFLGTLPLSIPPEGRPPYLTFGNVNFFASSQLMLLPLAALGLIHSGKIRWLAAIAIIVGISSILPTQTIAVYVALGVALTVLFILLPFEWSSDTNLRKKMVLVRAAMTLVVLAGTLLFVKQSGRLTAFSSMIKTAWEAGGKGIHPRSNSTEERIILWRHSLQLAQEKPIMGQGPGSWKYFIGKYGVKGFYNAYGTRFYTHPHNDFLEIWVERGWVGFVLWIGLVFGVFWVQMHVFFKGRTRDDRLWAGILLGGSVACLVEQQFNYSMYQIYHPVLWMVILAASAVLYFRKSPPTTKPIGKLPIQFGIGGITLFSIFMVWSLWQYWQGDRWMYRVKVDLESQNWAELVAHAQAAERNFYTVEPVNATPVAWYQGLGHLYQNKQPLALACFERAFSLHPYHVQVLRSYAESLIKNGQLEKGLDMYDFTLKHFPDYDECRKTLCETYQTLGRIEALHETAKYWDQNPPKISIQKYVDSIHSLIDTSSFHH